MAPNCVIALEYYILPLVLKRILLCFSVQVSFSVGLINYYLSNPGYMIGRIVVVQFVRVCVCLSVEFDFISA